MTDPLDLRTNRRRTGLDLRPSQSTPGNGEQYLAAMDSGKKKRLYVMVGGKKRYLKVAGSFTFTPGAALDTTASVGAVVGAFSAVAPSGGAVTYALATDSNAGFGISGSNLVLAALPNAGTFGVVVVASDATGWKYRLGFDVTIARPVEFPALRFSSRLQIGVALSGITVEGVPENGTVTSNVPGVTLDNSVRPVTASGTPTASGTIANAIVLTIGSTSQNNSADILAGAPAFSVDPSLLGSNIYEVGQNIGADPGAAPGATSFGFKIFRRNTGTGNGTAIQTSEGGDSQYRVPPAEEAGYQYRWRVRAFRGSLYSELYTPWTDAIAVANPGPPVYSAAPVIDGDGGVGSVLTVSQAGVATGASGSPSYQWVADGVDIDGATGTSYTVPWAYRIAVITCRESRTNSSSKIATALSNAIQANPQLTRAYHSNAPWFDGTVMRWMPPVLIDPWYPGKNGSAKMSRSTWSFSGDRRVDAYFRPELHYATPGTPIGRNIQISGYRNGVWTAEDTGGWKRQWLGASGRVSFLGLYGDFGNTTEQDGIAYGGRATAGDSHYQDTDIQGCRFIRMHGTDRDPWITPGKPSSGLNEAAIVSITRTGTNTVEIVLGTLPTGFRAPSVTSPARSYVMVYNVEVLAGVISPINVDWNTRYEITAWDSVTRKITCQITLINDGQSFGAAVGTSGIANTGRCVVTQTSVLGQHTDFAQKDKDKYGGITRRHGNTVTGNYQVGGIDGNSTISDGDLYISCEDWDLYDGFNPQEYNSEAIRIGQSTGSAYVKEMTNVALRRTRARTGLKMFPGTAEGASIVTVNGKQFLPFASNSGTTNRDNWRGGLLLDPNAPEYAPARASWWDWSTQFAGQRDPVNADMTAITLDNTTVAASAAAGTEIGQLQLTHTLPGADSMGRYPIIVNFTVSGPNAGKVTLGDSGILKYAGGATAGTPFNLTVTATVKDSALNYGAAVTFTATVTVNPT